MEHSDAVRIANGGQGAIVAELRRLDAERAKWQEIAELREVAIENLLDATPAAPAYQNTKGA